MSILICAKKQSFTSISFKYMHWKKTGVVNNRFQRQKKPPFKKINF